MKNSEIRVLCATRARAARCAEMLESFFDTRGSDRTQIYCYVDREDPQVREYEPLFRTYGIDCQFGPRHTMPDVINAGCWKFEADAYAEVNDDHIYRTKDWDLKLFAALMDGGLAYGKTQNLPSAVMISADCVRALGWMLPPYFQHQFLDNALVDLYGGAGMLHHVPEVWIEHCHPDFGKAAHDDTYGVMRSTFDGDRAMYELWKVNYLAHDLKRLVAMRTCKA